MDYQEMSYDIKDDLRNVEVRGIVEKLMAEYDEKVQKKLVRKD